MRDSIARRRSTVVEILNYRKDGSPFRNAVLVAPLYEPGGTQGPRYFLGSQMRIDEDAIGPGIAREARAIEAVRGLSKRRFEVLQMVASGLRNKQIAHDLGVAEKTVKMHRGLVMEKLGLRTTAEMIRLAVEAGI